MSDQHDSLPPHNGALKPIDAYFDPAFARFEDPEVIEAALQFKTMIAERAVDQGVMDEDQAAKYRTTISPDDVDAHIQIAKKGMPYERPIQQKYKDIRNGALAVGGFFVFAAGALDWSRHSAQVRYKVLDNHSAKELKYDNIRSDVVDGIRLVKETRVVDPNTQFFTVHRKYPFSFKQEDTLKKHASDFGSKAERNTPTVQARIKNGSLKLTPLQKRFVKFVAITHEEELKALPAEIAKLPRAAHELDKAAVSYEANHSGNPLIPRDTMAETEKLILRASKFIAKNQK